MLSFELNEVTTLTNPIIFGPRIDTADRPGLLRVMLENKQDKWNELRAAKNLAASKKENYKKKAIKKDMMQMEREEADLRKKLQANRIQAEESGEQCKWIIRRGRIVNQ